MTVFTLDARGCLTDLPFGSQLKPIEYCPGNGGLRSWAGVQPFEHPEIQLKLSENLLKQKASRSMVAY